MQCRGFEDALLNCTYDSNTADCIHVEDASVRCRRKCTICHERYTGSLLLVMYTACSNGEIRLEGGSTLYEGRVEICRNQQWGTVCDNMWTNVDAIVACRHLGYSGFGIGYLTDYTGIIITYTGICVCRCPSLLQCLLWSR